MNLETARQIMGPYVCELTERLLGHTDCMQSASASGHTKPVGDLLARTRSRGIPLCVSSRRRPSWFSRQDSATTRFLFTRNLLIALGATLVRALLRRPEWGAALCNHQTTSLKQTENAPRLSLGTGA